MRVKMRTTIANARITALAGSIIDVSKEEAADLLKGGYAEAVKDVRVEPAAKQPADEEKGKQTGKSKTNKADEEKGK